jgi:hypothetical protein
MRVSHALEVRPGGIPFFILHSTFVIRHFGVCATMETEMKNVE